jgi:hypothetical protein
MSKNLKKLSPAMDPPLTYHETTGIDPTTGAPIRFQITKRGIMRRTYVHTDMRTGYLRCAAFGSPRKRLERLCDTLRKKLEDKGLPTNLNGYWVGKPDGSWEPITEKWHDQQIDLRYGFMNWKALISSLTEEFSPERQTAELLYQVAALLSEPGVDPYLVRAGALMYAYGNFVLAGDVNRLAHQAMLAKEARAAGPRARHNRAQAIRQIVAEEAQKSWSTHALRKGDVITTAVSIAPQVNKRLKSENLLPANKDGLSAKTIADYIRKIMQG